MIVVDASVWISVSVPADVFHEPSRRWLISARALGERFAAPTVVLAEVAGGMSRRVGSPVAGAAGVLAIEQAPGLHLVDVDDSLGRHAAELAADLGLRGADAVYVATALRLACPIVTWDDEMVEKTRGMAAVYQPGP